MKVPLQDLESRYAAALQNYLALPAEAALHRAYELGRAALENGVGVLEMAALHHKALATLLSNKLRHEQSIPLVQAAENFFVESLAPFEMTHRAVQEANTALRQLNERLEEEAKRIAHTLHEETGQFLACVYLALEEFGRDLPPPARGGLHRVRDLLEQIGAQLRQLSHELRPMILDDFGLLPALEFLADGVSKRAGLQISVEGPENGRLPPAVETALYRVVQEALTNVSKHARATHANVRLWREPRMIHCSITDDGVGFDTSSVMDRKGNRGLGLVGIRQRLDVLGGTLQISSENGRGTQMLINVPLEA
jgi:two-component system, NarL family, sensor histidine kinase UhpB